MLIWSRFSFKTFITPFLFFFSFLFFLFYLAAAALEQANGLSLTFIAGKEICAQGFFFFYCLFFYPSLFNSFRECCFLALSQLWGTASARVCPPLCGGNSAAGPAGLRGLGWLCTFPVSSRPLIGCPASREGRGVGIPSCGFWHSFFLFKNRLVWGAPPGWVPCSLTEWDWRRTETATGQTEVAKGKSAEMFSQGPRTPASGCYYLNSMTPEGREMYLRFDQTTRRSPYRMSRILARHQLVTKIQQGEWPVVAGGC